mgnify:CR=1 FL=1
MQKFFLFTFFVLFSFLSVGQETDSTLFVKGRVLNAADDLPIEDVNIVNLNEVIGSITNEKGEFKIKAAINDTLFFSYLGYKSIEVRVTNDWKKFGEVKIKMTEIGIALEEVTDPRNIGSIIRSATSFNIDGLIVKERHFPYESKLMYKSASGCMEHLNIFIVPNINSTLKFLRDKLVPVS